MAYDPFAGDDVPATPVANAAPVGPVAAVAPGGNSVSFTFNSAPGYDRVNARVQGDPDFVAKVFAVEDFDGKISTLMKRAVEVDKYFKKQYGATQGKA